MTGEHPLARILRGAALGAPPPPDGGIEILPPLDGPVDAVCAFTAHNVVAAAVPGDEIRAHLDPEDLGSPMSAGFLAWLAARLGTLPGVVDAVLVAPAEPAVPQAAVARRDDLWEHPRVARSLRYRNDLRVYADPAGDGVLMVGRGLAGRWEMSFEVDPGARGRGLGRSLVAAARSLIPAGEPLFAQCSPGNAASLRAILAAGYRPIGAECLFLRSPRRGPDAGRREPAIVRGDG